MDREDPRSLHSLLDVALWPSKFLDVEIRSGLWGPVLASADCLQRPRALQPSSQPHCLTSPDMLLITDSRLVGGSDSDRLGARARYGQ